MTDEFKKMPFKKKIEHIWEYYRLNIFLVIFSIALVSSLINAVFINPAPKTYAGVAFYDNYINSDVISVLNNSFTEKFVPEGENLQVKFSSYYDSEQDPTIAVDMAQKFEMLLYAREIDIIITGKNKNTGQDYFDSFANQGIIAPLDKIFSQEELNNFQENGILRFCNDADGNKKPFGICTKNTTSILKDYKGFEEDSRYVGISNITERVENAKQIFKAIAE